MFKEHDVFFGVRQIVRLLNTPREPEINTACEVSPASAYTISGPTIKTKEKQCLASPGSGASGAQNYTWKLSHGKWREMYTMNEEGSRIAATELPQLLKQNTNSLCLERQPHKVAVHWTEKNWSKSTGACVRAPQRPIGLAGDVNANNGCFLRTNTFALHHHHHHHHKLY